MELKRSLGQHFLHDQNMLQKIADVIGDLSPFASVLEIGPGHGALTKYLLLKKHYDFKAVEVDRRCVEFLQQNMPELKVINVDFLKADLTQLLKSHACIVGNFPYNISSQIVFKIIENRAIVSRMTGMFQKEVAVRIAAPHGSKDYGVISVLTQAYFDCTYLLDVPPGCFTPPPKVMSGIIKLERKNAALGCDEKLFRTIVKQSFTQRRKILSNSLKGIDSSAQWNGFESKRPEQLSVADFVSLTNLIADAQSINNR
jgi:16S rRNA (adenine1518-N6/adenine1519-N6)-dimethyltransferase